MAIEKHHNHWTISSVPVKGVLLNESLLVVNWDSHIRLNQSDQVNALLRIHCNHE